MKTDHLNHPSVTILIQEQNKHIYTFSFFVVLSLFCFLVRASVQITESHCGSFKQEGLKRGKEVLVKHWKGRGEWAAVCHSIRNPWRHGDVHLSSGLVTIPPPSLPVTQGLTYKAHHLSKMKYYRKRKG